MSRPDLRVVGGNPATPIAADAAAAAAAVVFERTQCQEALRHLLEVHDEAERLLAEAKRLIRPLARSYADARRQMTMPTLDQLRREL
jgi:hypothetical protein